NVANEHEEQVALGLYYLYLSLAIFTTVIFLLVMIFFSDHPKNPPSLAQFNKMNGNNNETSVSFCNSLRSLMRSKDYILLLLSCGLNVGVNWAVSTLINQILLNAFNGDVDVR